MRQGVNISQGALEQKPVCVRPRTGRYERGASEGPGVFGGRTGFLETVQRAALDHLNGRLDPAGLLPLRSIEGIIISNPSKSILFGKNYNSSLQICRDQYLIRNMAFLHV